MANPPLNPGLAAPNIRPRGDRVLVKVDPVVKTTPSGIHMPDTAEKKAQRGTVLAKGPGRRTPDGTRVPITDLHIGQRIIFSKFAGAQIDNEQGVPTEYSLISETDIIGIMP